MQGFSVNAKTPCERALKISIAAIDAPLLPLCRFLHVLIDATVIFVSRAISPATFPFQCKPYRLGHVSLKVAFSFLPRGQHESRRALALERVARVLIFFRGRKRVFFATTNSANLINRPREMCNY